MHSARPPHLFLAGLAILLLAGALTPAAALPAPSKTAPDQTLAERESDLAALASVLDQKEVTAALAAHGFTREEANLRLAQLAPEELSALATQVEQLQAAGYAWPWWIWLVVAGVIVIAIVSI
ncbi:MAG TPA: PA2779 family protein [Thermoanaerobaculia bacterium]